MLFFSHLLFKLLLLVDLKLENVLFTHNTLRKEVVDHGGKQCTVNVPVNTNIKRTSPSSPVFFSVLRFNMSIKNIIRYF